MVDRVRQDGCEAYRLFGTPDEFMLELLVEDFKVQSWAHDSPDEPELDEYREWSIGITAWQIIGFSLDRGLPMPPEVFSYLHQTASRIADWAALNEHPGELKDILQLGGKRKLKNESNDPRWVYCFISQMKANDPTQSIKKLTQEFCKQHPKLNYSAEAIRQKYYEGKKLAETGQDYKGRGRKNDLRTGPTVEVWRDDPKIDFR